MISRKSITIEIKAEIPIGRCAINKNGTLNAEPIAFNGKSQFRFASHTTATVYMTGIIIDRNRINHSRSCVDRHQALEFWRWGPFFN